MFTCLALLATGCASDWPEAVPDHNNWQLRSAPIMSFPTIDGDDVAEGGVYYAAHNYAFNWQERRLADDQHNNLWVPSRLDVICRDRDNDGDGEIEVALVPSNLILKAWPPIRWEAVELVFSKDEKEQSRPIPMVVDKDSEGGIWPFIGRSIETQAGNLYALNRFSTELKRHALSDSATVDAIITFPENSSPPITIKFQLGKKSGAENLRRLFVRCGEVW